MQDRIGTSKGGIKMASIGYYTPTKVLFGKEAENQVGEVLKAEGATKVLVHFGAGSVKKSGLLDRVEARIKEAGIDFIELGGVVPNPRVSLVRKKAATTSFPSAEVPCSTAPKQSDTEFSEAETFGTFTAESVCRKE